MKKLTKIFLGIGVFIFLITLLTGGDSPSASPTSVMEVTQKKSSPEPLVLPESISILSDSEPEAAAEVLDSVSDVPIQEEIRQPSQDIQVKQEQNCHASYSGCLNPNASDYDCAGGSGNGPYYTGRVQVYGSDPFGLDRDGDGWGCE